MVVSVCARQEAEQTLLKRFKDDCKRRGISVQKGILTLLRGYLNG